MASSSAKENLNTMTNDRNKSTPTTTTTLSTSNSLMHLARRINTVTMPLETPPTVYPMRSSKSPHRTASEGRSRSASHRPICPQYIFDTKYQTTYTIHQCLGKGGFAYVYRATSDSETFAIKVISLSKIKAPCYNEKIQREIDIHKRLQHANIVSLYSTFQDEFNVYLLLDYCPYGTLLDYINSREHNRLSENHSIIFLKQILKATRYLHAECRILHRDIKPGNVLLSSSMTAKLADFGFACPISEEKNSQQHTLCGTPNYLAPEVIRRKGHSPLSESWAIGCTFYCMLFGRPPFESDRIDKTYEMIQRCAFYFPENTTVSKRSIELVRRVLVESPSKRLAIPDILSHEVFLPLNRSLSHGSCLATQLDYGYSKSCQNLLSPTTMTASGKFPRSLSRISSRVNVDSGLGTDPSSSFSRGLTKLIEKYIHLIDALVTDIGTPSRIVCDVVEDAELPDVFVAKWVDYTNRFGFGCTLKNGIRTALFLDDSAISTTPDERSYAYWPRKTQDECSIFTRPTATSAQSECVEFLSFMRTYMDKSLQSSVAIGEDAEDVIPEMVHIIAFKKFSGGIFILLSDGTCQLNINKYAKVVFRHIVDAVVVTVSHNNQCHAFELREQADVALRPTAHVVQITDYLLALSTATDVFRDFCRNGSSGNLASAPSGSQFAYSQLPVLSTAC